MSVELANLCATDVFPKNFSCHYWQSNAWKKAKEDNGCTTFEFTHKNATALVIERRAHFLKFWVKPLWEVPRGPIGNAEDFSVLLEKIFAKAKKHNVSAVRVYPPFGSINFWSNKIFTELLEKYSHKTAPEIFPCNTLMIDLNQSEEEILAQMKQKGRYNIKIAKQKGVKIIEEKNVENFWKLMQETSARDGFRSNKKHVYSDLLKSFGDDAVLFTAKDMTEGGNEDVLASAIFTISNTMAIYNYGASTNRKRSLMAPYLLQWAGMQWAKKKGAGVYDFLGISPENSPKHSLDGVASFKLKFGGVRVVCDEGLDFLV